MAAVADLSRLDFGVEGASVDELAVVPTLRLAVRIRRAGGGPVRSIVLQAQVRIAAPRRSYDGATEQRLVELYGPVEQWGRTMQSLLWTQSHAVVPPFEDETVVSLPVPCTYDFEVAAAKYLDALRDGDVPLELLFSGTVFEAGAGGRLQLTHIGSDCEAAYRLPVRVWREAMDRHFPDGTWLRLPRSAFDRLYAYRARHALRTWEDTVETLLREAGA